MNKTFKIVFNKARGALMVANEITGSVQKKGLSSDIETNPPNDIKTDPPFSAVKRGFWRQAVA